MPEKNKGFTSPLVDDEMIKTVIDFEGDIPHMYLDTKGKVTAGPGFHLQDREDAARRPFRHMTAEDKFDRPTTAGEVVDAYDRLIKKSRLETMLLRNIILLGMIRCPVSGLIRTIAGPK